jgi:Protein of unknown function (DUF2934)
MGAQVRAYELYEERGKRDGHALEDWLQAKTELTGAEDSSRCCLVPRFKSGSESAAHQQMNTSALIATGVTVLIVLAAIIFVLLFGASQVAGLAALGRLPKLPKNWRRFPFDEHNDRSID